MADATESTGRNQYGDDRIVPDNPSAIVPRFEPWQRSEEGRAYMVKCFLECNPNVQSATVDDAGEWITWVEKARF